MSAHRRAALALALLPFLVAPNLRAESPIEPRLDPVDGQLWRGDQFHSVSHYPEVDGSFEKDGHFSFTELRMGFHPPRDGKRWQAIFAPARFYPEKVERVVLVSNPFHPKTSHLSLLFEGPGVVVRGDTGETEDGLVLSVEGRVPANEGYSLWKGLHGEYRLVYQLSTWADYKQHIMDIYQGRLERFLLRLTPEEVRETARVALNVSLRDHREDWYHLIRASCTTASMDILFDGIRKRFQKNLWTRLQRAFYMRKFLGGVLTHPSMSLPHRIPGLLVRRGLIEERLPDLP